MSEDQLETGWSCNHSGRIVDVGRGVIRCGCGHFSESLGEAVERLQGELDASHRFLNDIGPPPDLPLPDRLRHWQNYCRLMRDDMRGKDTMITTLRADNLLLVKRASALRKLNIAYRLGDQKLADAALTELEALAPAQEE